MSQISDERIAELDGVVKATQSIPIMLLTGEVSAIIDRVRATEAERDAAIRLFRNNYTPWVDAGGIDECEHGFARGIACRKCDFARVFTVTLPQPEIAKESV